MIINFDYRKNFIEPKKELGNYCWFINHPAVFSPEFKKYFNLTNEEFMFWVYFINTNNKTHYFSKEYILQQFYGKTRWAEKTWKEFQIVEKLSLATYKLREGSTLHTYYQIKEAANAKLQEFFQWYFENQLGQEFEETEAEEPKEEVSAEIKPEEPVEPEPKEKILNNFTWFEATKEEPIKTESEETDFKIESEDKMTKEEEAIIDEVLKNFSWDTPAKEEAKAEPKQNTAFEEFIEERQQQKETPKEEEIEAFLSMMEEKPELIFKSRSDQEKPETESEWEALLAAI